MRARPRLSHTRLILILLLQMHSVFIQCFNCRLLRLETATPLLCTRRTFLEKNTSSLDRAIFSPAVDVGHESIIVGAVGIVSPLGRSLLGTELFLRILNVVIATQLRRKEVRPGVIRIGLIASSSTRKLIFRDDLACGTDMARTCLRQLTHWVFIV